ARVGGGHNSILSTLGHAFEGIPRGQYLCIKDGLNARLVRYSRAAVTMFRQRAPLAASATELRNVKNSAMRGNETEMTSDWSFNAVLRSCTSIAGIYSLADDAEFGTEILSFERQSPRPRRSSRQRLGACRGPRWRRGAQPPP